MNILPHPLLPTLLLCILSVWPLSRIYARVGLPPYYALLIFASLLVPFSGYFLGFLPLAIKPWPNFPKPEPAPKPVKTAI